MKIRWLGLLFSLVACGDDGGAAIGDACTTRGSSAECVEGAVCDEDDTGTVCLEICLEQEDCGSDQNCNGISGSSIKACHTKE